MYAALVHVVELAVVMIPPVLGGPKSAVVSASQLV